MSNYDKLRPAATIHLNHTYCGTRLIGRGGTRSPLLAHLVDCSSLALAVLAGLVLAVLTLLTFVDVVLRYVFTRPIPGAQDVQAVAMIIVLFLALPLVTRMDGRIVVDLVPVPVGLNVFVGKGLVRDLPIREIYVGILPF